MSELVINPQTDLLAAPQGADDVISSTQQSECTKLDYFIMGLLIWSSGNPSFQLLLSNSQTTYIGLLFLLLALNYRLLFLFSNSVQTFLIWGFFGGVAFFHIISGVPLRSELGLLIRLSIALVAAIRLHKYFAKLYLWWFLLLGKVSLVFWVLSLLGLLTSSSSIIVFICNLFGWPHGYLIFHTFHPYSVMRNCGIFWEPGAYAGYVLIAILFLFSTSVKEHIKNYRFNLIMLLIVLLSTFSTTGYIALFFITMVYILRLFRKNSFLATATLILFLSVSYYSYRNLDFLSGKITKETEAINDEKRNWEMTRLGAMMVDYDYIREKPFWGWGNHYETIGASLELKAGMGNGLSDFALKNGIISLLLWCYGCYCFAYMQLRKKAFAFLFLITCIVNLQGEIFLAYPVFLSFMFCGFILKADERKTSDSDGRA